MSFDEMHECLLNYVVPDHNEDTIDIVFAINGCNEQSARDILYYYTGYNDFEQFIKEEIDFDYS